MPRNRNRNEFVIETQDIVFEHTDKKKIIACSTYLCNSFYDLLKESNKEIKCSTCMDDINCRDCFYLRSCGHYSHIRCAITWKGGACPVCER